MGNLKQSVDILHWLVVDTFISSEGLIKKYYNQQAQLIRAGHNEEPSVSDIYAGVRKGAALTT